MTYSPITPEVKDKLISLLGRENVITDTEKMQPYAHDEVTDPAYHHLPEVVVTPETTEQTAAVVRLANQYRFPVVPRGAGTGLACGAVPIYGGLVLSLEKMNHILEINDTAMYAVVEAGVRTADLQEAAMKHNLFYAGDPCSGDSCQIGGNIATNAGGNKAVKYGTTRHQIYDITVVNPLGEIVRLGTRLKKQSTGYMLDGLIIGSEGTLGIITNATVKLLPLLPYKVDILAVFETAETAINAVSDILRNNLTPTCIEFMDTATLHSVEKFLNMSLPGSNGNHLIIEIEGETEDDVDDKTVRLDELCTKHGAVDVLVADPKRIWKARKAFAEAVRAETLIVCKEDIVVPVHKEPELLTFIAAQSAKYSLITRIAAHAGDGNIHLNILKNDNLSYEEWKSRTDRNQQELYSFVYSVGGRLSGEHGIGYKRRDLMEEFTDPVELSMMRAVKKALDPNNILNPGKIFTFPTP